MSSFILKIIGIITMLLDHIGLVFYDESILRFIGRLAFPIFAFQASLGYEHTKNIKKYLLKLFIFAIISQIPYYLMTIDNGFHFNSIFTISFGVLSIVAYNKLDKLFDKILAISLICILATCLRVEYGIAGILSIFFFNKFKDNKIILSILFSLLFTLYYSLFIVFEKEIIYNLFLLLGTLLSLIPINLYNGQEGKKLKYFFYIFYPLHMLIIWLLSTIIK